MKRGGNGERSGDLPALILFNPGRRNSKAEKDEGKVCMESRTRINKNEECINNDIVTGLTVNSFG